MFNKYKIVPWTVAGKQAWGVSKRFLLFFYRPLTHTKIVRRKGYSIGSSKEILTFWTLERAKKEILYLNSGRKCIKTRVYENGHLTHVIRYT